jgi:succinate-acetate transporter protein
MAKVKYYYDSENLAYRIKIKKRNKFGFVIFFGIGLVWLSYICDLIKHPILTPERPLVDS